VAEGNFGGEMVRSTIRGADPNVPVRLVTASRGKIVRAEPVSLRYEKGEVHHVGRLKQDTPGRRRASKLPKKRQPWPGVTLPPAPMS
jgi:hypothetical protein